MVSYAGQLAKMAFGGEMDLDGSKSDPKYAVDFASFMVGDDWELEADLEWLCRGTVLQVALPSNYWAIQAVADELIVHSELSSRAVRKIIKANNGSPDWSMHAIALERMGQK